MILEFDFLSRFRSPDVQFFQKTSLPKDAEKVFESAKKTDFSRIRCPHCRWQPTKTSLWCCVDCAQPEFFFGGCWTEWNTFETGGRCPGCAHQWRYTACLRCDQFSLHEDWYEGEAN